MAVGYDLLGPVIVLGLGCIGSSIGCCIGGMAANAVMSRVEENHGKFLGMAGMAATQSIYAIVMMFILKTAIREGNLDPLNGIGIGLFVGLALAISAIYMGMCAATGIQAVAKQPAIVGRCFTILGIIEGFALFAFALGAMLTG